MGKERYGARSANAACELTAAGCRVRHPLPNLAPSAAWIKAWERWPRVTAHAKAAAAKPRTITDRAQAEHSCPRIRPRIAAAAKHTTLAPLSLSLNPLLSEK